MIDLSIAANEDERLALAIFQAMERGTLLDVMLEICSDDFVWANSGLPTLNGQDEIRDLMARGGFRNEIPILNTQTHFSADVLHIASRGGAVLTERIDHHWNEEGRDLMTPHIAGVVEVRGGKLTALRDFYDVACYQQTPTDIDPEFTLDAHRARVAALSAPGGE